MQAIVEPDAAKSDAGPRVHASPAIPKRFSANAARGAKAADGPIVTRNTDGRAPLDAVARSTRPRSASKSSAQRCGARASPFARLRRG